MPTLMSVEREMFSGSVRLLFDRDLSVPDVGRFVFERAVPPGVEISIDMSQVGAFELSGVTFDVLRQMREDVATRVASAPEIAPDGATPGVSSPPGVPVEMSEDELVEWVHLQLEGAHVIGDVAEVVAIFAAHGTELAVVAEALGPIGPIASTIIVLWATWRAFGTGTRLREQEGFCYGVVWEASGTPNQTKVFWASWGVDSEDDLRESFYDGVAKGRAAAQEPKVRNAVLLVAGYHMARGTPKELAFRYVVEALYEKINEAGATGTVLPFPTPPDFPWRP
jgi:hypothetical protein